MSKRLYVGNLAFHSTEDSVRGAFQRAYVYDFIRAFASPLTRKVVEQAIANGVPSSASSDGGEFDI